MGDTDTWLTEEVAALKLALTKAASYDDAMVILSMASNAAVRTLEPDFYSNRSIRLEDVRSRIAHTHLMRIAGKQADDTRAVSPEVVQGWAYATLTEWLPGWTDFCAEQGGQYVITHLGDNRFRVNTPDGQDPRTFRVAVAATELCA